MSSTTVIGHTQFVDLPVDDPVEARRATDRARERFDADIHAAESPSPYKAAQEALAGLEDLRADVDQAEPGPSSVTDGLGVHDRYTSIIDVLLQDIHKLVGQPEEDPAAHRGPQLFEIGLRQVEHTNRMATVLARGGHSGTWSPETKTEVDDLFQQLERAREQVSELAAGTQYEPATEQLQADLDDAGFLSSIQRYLETDTPNIVSLLASLSVPGDGGWPAFVESVAQVMRDA